MPDLAHLAAGKRRGSRGLERRRYSGWHAGRHRRQQRQRGSGYPIRGCECRWDEGGCFDLAVGAPKHDTVTHCGACGLTCSLNNAIDTECGEGQCQPTCESGVDRRAAGVAARIATAVRSEGGMVPCCPLLRRQHSHLPTQAPRWTISRPSSILRACLRLRRSCRAAGHGTISSPVTRPACITGLSRRTSTNSCSESCSKSSSGPLGRSFCTTC